MTRRKRIKISGSTPAELALTEKIEKHLAIPLYDGVPGERLICTADIKQSAWALNNAPKILRKIVMKPRNNGATVAAAQAIENSLQARQAFMVMVEQKHVKQQEELQQVLREQYEREREARNSEAVQQEPVSGAVVGDEMMLMVEGD